MDGGFIDEELNSLHYLSEGSIGQYLGWKVILLKTTFSNSRLALHCLSQLFASVASNRFILIPASFIGSACLIYLLR